ncbi:hypothetical protein [Aminipila sp.]|uniref:hypothetical protein n=1 Tax=Aminipila sp. TaxID=2060095 RepID=UPI00289A4C15|nr:hypothetical protein [Aminipila sp.]
MVVESNGITFYIVPWTQFVEKFGLKNIDKNIASEFRNTTKKYTKKHICSTIQSGKIFAWESICKDKNKELQFALSLNFNSLLRV